MKTRKYNKYILVRVSGEVEQMRVPYIWGAFEVAEKLRQTEVFVEITKKEMVWSDNKDCLIHGPAWAYADKRKSRLRLVDHAPETSADCSNILRDIGALS